MDQHALYRTLDDAGCTILMFEDHPQFFGNWRAHFKRLADSFEIVCDNREGWLTLWKRTPDGKQERIREVEAPRTGDEAVLEVLGSWLDEIRGTRGHASSEV